MATPQTIVIESDAQSPADLEMALRDQLTSPDVQLEIRSSESPFRIDPVTLVALIAGGAQVLSALIAGAFTLANRAKKPSSLLIETADGVVMELRGADGQEVLDRVLTQRSGRTGGAGPSAHAAARPSSPPHQDRGNALTREAARSRRGSRVGSGLRPFGRGEGGEVIEHHERHPRAGTGASSHSIRAR
jgi:hypothetical protein